MKIKIFKDSIFPLLLWVLLLLNFHQNIFNIAPDAIWNRWQLVGQSRVLGGIIADKLSLDKEHANLGEVYYRKPDTSIDGPDPFTKQTYEIYSGHNNIYSINFNPYRAQLGLHEVFYSALVKKFGITSLENLQFIAAFSTSIAILALFLLYRKIFGFGFALLFVACLGMSPYFVTMAKNLYWSPALFFLPAVISGWMYLNRRTSSLAIGFLLITLAMFLKAGSSYEYITSVTVLACSVFLAGPFFSKNPTPSPDWGMTLLVGFACVLGFFFAFTLHASVRGDTILDGIRNIYEQDIVRRTFGDATKFSDETAESLKSSVIDVIKIYLYEKYPGRREMMMPGKIFIFLIFISITGIIHKKLTQHPLFLRDFALFAVYLMVPLSWFVIAKGHSYTQTHINFVLLFIGFMPALLYVSASSMQSMLQHLKNKFQA